MKQHTLSCCVNPTATLFTAEQSFLVLFTCVPFKLDSNNPEAPVLTWFPRSFGPDSRGWASSTHDLFLCGAVFHPESSQNSREDCWWWQGCSVLFCALSRTYNHRGHDWWYSRRTSFVSGTSLKWKSLGQHFSQLVCAEHYSLRKWEIKKEQHRSNGFEKWRFYKPTGTVFWNT